MVWGDYLLLIYARSQEPGRAEPLLAKVEHAVQQASGWHAWKWRMRLSQARAELVDADETVDREIRREYVSRGKHRLGDRLARPGKTGQEQLR